MKKRMLYFMLVALLAVGVLTGCSAGKEEVTSDGPIKDGEEVSEADYDPFGKYEDPLTVTSIMGYSPPTDPGIPSDTKPESFSFIKEAKEKLNIDYEWLWTAPGDQMEQKFGVAMVSGDLPDIMEVSYTDYEILKENDMIGDWNEALKYISPKMEEFLMRDGGEALETLTEDGKVMAIPQYFDTRRELDMMMIRQDWLDELGLEVPETTGQLKEVMRSFKEDKGASHPLALDTGWGHDPKTIMQSFGAYQDAWILKDGKLVNGNIQPEMKVALQFLHDAYNDGLLANDFVSYDTDKSTELIVGGDTGIMVGPWWMYEFSINKSVEKNPDAKWLAYPIPSSEGNLGKPLRPRVQYERIYVLNKNMEHPEAAMKLFNMFVQGNHEGDDWTKLENGYVWSWCVPKFMDPADIQTIYDDWNAQIEKDPNFENPLPTDIFESQSDQDVWEAYPDYMKWKDGDTDIDIDPAIWGIIMARQDPDFGWGTVIEIAEDDSEVVYNEFHGTPTETTKEKGSTLNKIREETFLKMIMGEESIENFDGFVESWKNLGGDEITDEVNEWYKDKK